MNNLYSVVSNSLGFTRAISVEPEKFPVLLEDILIKPNDFLTENNFNYSLSCLYQDFISIVSDSYLYNPNFPVTDPFQSNTNNIVGTLCGTFVPSNFSNDGQTSINYYKNGIPHSNNAFNIVYNAHDFVISGDYITVAVGILSATTLSPILSTNVYYPALGIYNYSLSSIFLSSEATNNQNFPNQGVLVSDIKPNYGYVTKFLNKKLNLKFNAITKLKITDERLYVLDNVSNKFLIYDVSDVTINRTKNGSFDVPLETLGFATSSRNNTRKITSFCVNENYIAFFNYVSNAISIFSTNLTQLYDYAQDKVSELGSRNTEVFADIEFDTFGNLYLLTQNGTVYVYSVSNTALTLIKTYSIIPKTSTVFSTLSSFQSVNQTEVFKKLSFSKSDTNVFYVSTNTNIYKRFVDKNVNIGQFNNFVNNTTYYSTLSNIADPFETLMVPNPADYPNEKSSFDFYKYKINSINSVKYQGKELFSVCFVDNCTYEYQNSEYYIGNIGTWGSIDFITANNIFGMNPVSASGITFVVDSPNYINLNNDSLSSIQVYSLDEILVKPDEFITDFTINKSLRKLLYSIFNYQTYQAFKPVVDIDINNNALYKKLEYIVSYNKDQDITNFDNFVGINEITSTIFLNRCFTKVYELLTTLQDNYNSRVINVYPRYADSVLLNQTSQKFVSLYNDSEQFISGEYDTEVAPLNPNMCVVVTPTPVVATPSPSSTPGPQPSYSINTPGATVTPTPTPAPAPTLPPTPTPSGYVLVNKTIQHVATVYLNNEYEFPVPQPPYPNYDIKPLSAVYDGTGIDTIVSEFSAYFDQAGFYIALAAANGDYTKLVGKTFGDYTLQSYTPSSNSEYLLGAQGCGLETGTVQGITPTPTPSITPTKTVTPTPTPSITPSSTVTPSNTITPTITVTPTNTPTPTITPTPTASPSISYSVSYVAVGGGGAGGSSAIGTGGGGGGGDVVSGTTTITTGVSFNIAAGAGGIAGSSGGDGSDSYYYIYYGYGGGKGGNVNAVPGSYNVLSGNSGGNGGGGAAGNNLSTSGGSGSPGFSGGTSYIDEGSSIWRGGGGGGETAAGTTATALVKGDGGAGTTFSWIAATLGSGGGGGVIASSSTSGGLGGTGAGNGGGAVAGSNVASNGSDGTHGTGGGGGGGAAGNNTGTSTSTGGNGGNGALYFKFPVTYSDPTISGINPAYVTATTVGSDRIITIFNNSTNTTITGTITFNP